MAAHLHNHLDHFHARLRGSRLAMFGLDRLPRVYEAGFGWLGEPLYQRVAADAAEAGLGAGGRVLDIGTGPGRLPEYLHRLRPDLVVEGVDVSEEMIARARTRTGVGDQGSDGLRYTVADVARLPHADGSVDLVVSSLSLHHWPDPAAGLREVRRILRPGGRAWIYDVTSQLNAAQERLSAAGAETRVAALVPRPDARRSLRDHVISAWVSRLEIG